MSQADLNKPTPWLTERKNALISTSMGEVNVELYGDIAPLTVSNFVGLATARQNFLDTASKEVISGNFYDNIIFHRVISNFMIQTGCPMGRGTGGPGYQFEDETDSAYTFDKPGILAMANSGPGTNGSQFFITVAATPWLNGKHTIFGHVTDGYDVVEKISLAETVANDKPATEISIKSVSLVD